MRLGVIGVGNRGTALLRSLLELPGTADRRGLRRRAQAPAARAGDRREGARPAALRRTTIPRQVLDRDGHRRGRRRPAVRPARAGLSRCDRGRKAPLRREAAGDHARRLRSADRRGSRRAPARSFMSASSGGRTRGFARGRADPPRASWVRWSRPGQPGPAATAR